MSKSTTEIQGNHCDGGLQANHDIYLLGSTSSNLLDDHVEGNTCRKGVQLNSPVDGEVVTMLMASITPAESANSSGNKTGP